ncbi:MAG: alpha-ketoglutarate-dependent dioxygenase AlkB [Xanthomonadales bacterium]|nr:alpha-ketoglutarate-dependent dioxygenase AlkB [Xanthomonadales bacterium]
MRRGWLTRARADDLLQRLWRELPFRRDQITLFGRRVEQPRLTAWCSDPGVDYRYSGLWLRSRPWRAGLDMLRDELEEAAGARFNSVLVNAYRDGRDSMGWHADNEPELGANPTIASLSLGESRRFRIRPSDALRRHGRSLGIDLGHGDLLLMSGSSQSRWQHCITRTRREVGLRINLTFRNIRGGSISAAGQAGRRV